MSRCFPFPPPGYDKKPIPEDVNVLKEERQKEKKHKKDKKNKEKREGKEQRDKERSEGKHKEKRDKKDKHKDKKEKHREKKEKKDRGKEKEKSGSSEVAKVSVAEVNFGEKLVLKEGKDYTLDENTYAVRFHGQNGEEPVQCNFIARGAEESKYVQDLGRRFKDQEKATSNHLERLPGAEKRRDDERERFGVSSPRNSGEEKGKSKNKEFDIRKMDGQGYREEARFSGHAMAQNIVGAAKTKASEMPAMLEKNDKRRMEGKEQTKDKREKRGDNHKDKDTGKKDHGKDKDRAKERKKEEKAKNKSELDKFIDANRSNLTSATHMAASISSEPSNKIKAEGNLKKRKHLEINGFHDKEIRPSKLQRPASHPVMENGRKFEGSQTPGFFASDMPGASLKLDNKKHVKNGTVESQPLPLQKEKPLTPIVPDVILEVSRKHPHPDSKYLNEVLSVPKMEEWPDVVDNDWLSDSKDCLSRKAEVGRVVSEKPMVWSNTLYLESADVVALPYVVPY